MIALIAVLMVLAALAIAGCKTSRSGYESAPYRVVKAEGKAELRDYPALTVVETPMVASGNGADHSFSRLFRFISGGNAAKEKISMTTPVFMDASASNQTMAFVMPAGMAAAQVPQPLDDQLKVREIPPGRFAVLRFSGGRSAQNEAKSLRELQAWMTAQGLKSDALPVYAYFDPPWTPTFLRRNEVMLRTSPEKP